uniref:Uncharacterized protein n=1 Tax=viral metagenome TaxID=1070528 RepID=A0A6C0LR50_9ZZZZ
MPISPTVSNIPQNDAIPSCELFLYLSCEYFIAKNSNDNLKTEQIMTMFINHIDQINWYYRH